jgi:hypothetical protein
MVLLEDFRAHMFNCTHLFESAHGRIAAPHAVFAYHGAAFLIVVRYDSPDIDGIEWLTND